MRMRFYSKQRSIFPGSFDAGKMNSTPQSRHNAVVQGFAVGMGQRTPGGNRNWRRRNDSGNEPETRHMVLVQATETLMIVLGFVWMGLLIVELAYGLSPLLANVFNVVWAVFILDFLVRLASAKDKIRYLKSNWITAISLMIPALRVLRVIRLLRLAPVARGVRLVRLLTSFNRSMRALGRTMGQRGFGYVVGPDADRDPCRGGRHVRLRTGSARSTRDSPATARPCGGRR